MKWYNQVGVAALVGAGTVLAQCDPITSNYAIAQGATVTVSAGESASASTSAVATVQTCGQVSMGPGGTVVFAGGTATMGVGSIIVPPMATGHVAAAYGASADVSEGGYLVAETYSGVATVRAGATMDVKFAPSGGLSGSGTMSMTGSNIRAYASGTAGFGYVTGSGVNAIAFTTGATAIADGTRANAGALNGGVATMSGTSGLCSLGVGGTCTIAGTSQWMYCYSGASADLFGASNSGQWGRGCTGTVSGSGNRATSVATLARVTVQGGAEATIASGGAAYVEAGVSRVTINDGGSATLMPGATVTAAAQAQLFAAGAGVEYTSVSDSDGYTVYAARAVGTLRRRAAQPLPTGSCGIGKTTCPDLSGGFRCVDVRTDIFNCGGCNFGPDVLQVGVDCTSLFDGDVQCVAGQCVSGSV